MNVLLPALFFLSALFIGFTSGIAYLSFGGPGSYYVRTALDYVKYDAKYWQNDLGIEPTRHIAPARHRGNGVTRWESESTAPGLTFLAGLIDGDIKVQLIQLDGGVVREWPIAYNALVQEAGISLDLKEARRNWNVHIHGALALPDGSIVFSFDGGHGLFRVDRCGQVLWGLSEDYHHSLHYDSSSGTLWSPVDTWSPKIAEITLDGTVLRVVDIREIMLDADRKGVIDVLHERNDPWHFNDAETLDPSMADAFPLFEAGDLVVSARNANLLAVVDPDTSQLKWHQTGPWHRQHDPDFTADGRIVVFDNRMGAPPSQILAVTPQSGVVDVIYRPEDEESFYTFRRGKQEVLANGNILITESEAGRVFEINADDDIVWEYISRFDEDHIGYVTNARRYPPGYFEVTDWSCPDA